jgi:hypothetical protein
MNVSAKFLSGAWLAKNSCAEDYDEGVSDSEDNEVSNQIDSGGGISLIAVDFLDPSFLTFRRLKA